MKTSSFVLYYKGGFMRYKVGDKVRVRTLKDLQSRYRTFGGIIQTPKRVFVPCMRKWCRHVVTIANVRITENGYCFYLIAEDTHKLHHWVEEMFEEGSITKQAIFYLEKEIQGGVEGYKVIDYKNILSHDDLPKDYFEEMPYFFKDDKGRVFIQGNRVDEGYRFSYHDFIEKELWKTRIYPLLKKAGSKLHRILKKKRWSGRVEVKI